jgi:hypothetical protein
VRERTILGSWFAAHARAEPTVVDANSATVAEDTVHGSGVAARADGLVPNHLTVDEEATLRLHYEMRLQVRTTRDASSISIPASCTVAGYSSPFAAVPREYTINAPAAVRMSLRFITGRLWLIRFPP